MNADELVRIQSVVMSHGERYYGDDLVGAQIDCGAGLCQFGFSDPEIERTVETTRMVVYRCRPTWTPATPEGLVQRLEEAWREYGAFRNEAHSIAVADDTIALDFVTWWGADAHSQVGAYYTGRIEVALGEIPGE